jgi:hypothetical protein
MGYRKLPKVRNVNLYQKKKYVDRVTAQSRAYVV